MTEESTGHVQLEGHTTHVGSVHGIGDMVKPCIEVKLHRDEMDLSVWIW